MPAWASSFAVTRLSSQAIRSASFRPSRARAVISPRLPIGVATRMRPPAPSGLLRGWLWLGFMRYRFRTHQGDGNLGMLQAVGRDVAHGLAHALGQWAKRWPAAKRW